MQSRIRHLIFAIRHSPFVIRHSTFAIRHSSFAIRHSPFAIRHSTFESGASLVEILVAIAIIVSGLVIFIAALSTGSFAVHSSNTLTTAANLAAVQLESIKAADYVTGTAAYPSIAAPAGYSVSNAVTEVGAGLQQVTVTVSWNGEILVTVSNYKVNR